MSKYFIGFDFSAIYDLSMKNKNKLKEKLHLFEKHFVSLRHEVDAKNKITSI
jgi:hypothetical protein